MDDTLNEMLRAAVTTGVVKGNGTTKKTASDRRIVLTPASDITPRPVVWMEQDRIAIGTLSIAAGREATGKSQWAAEKTALVTRGELIGALRGQPRAVFYVAIEDSWQYTIVPRLMAVGADLSLVFRVGVQIMEDDEHTISLPADNDALEQAIGERHAALIVIDPLLSTIHSSLDSHRAREMRVALDPLAGIADRTGCVILGIAHHNKSGGSDASAAILGSSAFKDVARSIFSFARDEETGDRVMSQSKNSLGSCDLPSMKYRIEPVEVQTPEGPANVSRLVWEGESARSVSDLMRDANSSPEERGALDDAEGWLSDFLEPGPGKVELVLDAAKAAGHSEKTLRRAKKRLGVTSEKIAPRDGASFWQWSRTGKMAKTAKIPLYSQVGQVGHVDRCDRCALTADRLVTHHATRERLCPSCCLEDGDA